jgi:hypothetical protein
VSKVIKGAPMKSETVLKQAIQQTEADLRKSNYEGVNSMKYKSFYLVILPQKREFPELSDQTP